MLTESCVRFFFAVPCCSKLYFAHVKSTLTRKFVMLHLARTIFAPKHVFRKASGKYNERRQADLSLKHEPYVCQPREKG